MLLAVSDQAPELNLTEYPEEYQLHAAVVLAPVTDFAPIREGGSIVAWMGKTMEEAPDAWQLASPNTHISDQSPPILFIHSSADRVVPFQQSLSAIELMGKKGAHAELILLAGAPHPFWNYVEWFGDTMDQAAAFFHKQFSL